MNILHNYTKVQENGDEYKISRTGVVFGFVFQLVNVKKEVYFSTVGTVATTKHLFFSFFWNLNSTTKWQNAEDQSWLTLDNSKRLKLELLYKSLSTKYLRPYGIRISPSDL